MRMPTLGLGAIDARRRAAAAAVGARGRLLHPKLGGGGGGGGGIPKLGGDGIGSGKMGLGLDLSKVASAYENGDIEPNELTNKATKLRYFSTKCSMVTPSLFLGADPVARDKAVLESNGVTHVLNAAGTACQNYHEGSFAYKTLHLYDTPREDISPVMYGAIDFIDAAIEGGGKVFVHCHQGVSRSSSMVIAYLMWKEGLSFDAAYTKTKEARGVCNPNAGFICRLLAFGKDIAGGEPPSPPRLYRMCPFVGGPVARGVEVARGASLSVGLLDARTAFVLHGEAGHFIYCGDKCHPDYAACARDWAAALVRFESADAPVELDHTGAEAGGGGGGAPSGAFWGMLGGGDAAGVPPRNPEYDKDYGVGTTPTIAPPEVPLVAMPREISAPVSMAGTSGLIPGIHTTAADDDTPRRRRPRRRAAARRPCRHAAARRRGRSARAGGRRRRRRRGGRRRVRVVAAPGRAATDAARAARARAARRGGRGGRA